MKDWPRNKVLAGVAVVGALLLVLGYLTSEQWMHLVTGALGWVQP